MNQTKSEPTMRVAPGLSAPCFSAEFVWAFLLLLGAAILAVTNRTFWIDECVTAEFAKQPTIAQCWQAMRRYPEIQVPFYMLYIWAYTHIFGSTEWVLRAAGIPWFVAGASVLVISLGRVTGTMILPALLISSSAFAWYYLNEARVYSVQLGVASATLGAAVGVFHAFSKGLPVQNYWRLFLLGLLLLCGTSVLGAAWGFFFFTTLLLLLPRSRWLDLWRAAPGSVSACGVGLAGLAAYYAWTMTLHARPADVGTTTLQTMVFVFYELLGAAGWGPGRFELRASGVGALKPFVVPLAAYLTLLAAVFWCGAKELFSRYGRRRVLLAATVMAIPFLVLCSIGMATRFRVLGRHVTPLLPLLWIPLIFGLVRLVKTRRGPALLLVGLFLLSCLGSSLGLRFAGRHEKDEYRGAAALASTAAAAGKIVWWNADAFGADYYNVRGTDNSASNRVEMIHNTPAERLRALPEPGVIIVSKPDIYDHFGTLAEYMRERDYEVTGRLPAFTIWSKRR